MMIVEITFRIIEFSIFSVDKALAPLARTFSIGVSTRISKSALYVSIVRGLNFIRRSQSSMNRLFGPITSSFRLSTDRDRK